MQKTFAAGLCFALLVNCGSGDDDQDGGSTATSDSGGVGATSVTGGATAAGGAGVGTGGAAMGGTTTGGSGTETGDSTTGGALIGGGPTGGAPTGGVGTGGGLTGGSPTGGAATGGRTGGATSGGAPAGGADTGGAETGGAETGGAETGSAETGGAETGGAETGGAETGGAETGGAETGGAETGGAETGGAETGGAAGAETGGSPATCSYLTDMPADAAPDVVGLRLAQLFDSQGSDGTRHYKEACGWYGALQVVGLLNDQGTLMTSLINRYDPYKDAYASLLAGTGSVDENVWGIVPAEIYLHNTDPQCLVDARALAAHQQANSDAQTRYAVDDMFMMTGLQVQAYRASRYSDDLNDTHYLDDTDYLGYMVPIMVAYLGFQDDEDGLFKQLLPDPNNPQPPPASEKWSRGNGWFASGLTEMLRELDQGHPGYTDIRQGYENMMEGLLRYQIQQGEDAGLWRQVVNLDTDCFAETSGSAMFANAMVTGIKNGWLDCETYGPAAHAAWIALVANLDEADGRLKNISDWMYGGSISDYCSRPRVTGDNHGQAPMMWTAAALLR